MITTRTRFWGFTSIILIGSAILLSILTPINLAIFSSINSVFPSTTFWMTITNSGDVIFVGCLLFIALRKHQQLLTYAVLCGISIHYIIKFAKSTFSVLRPEHAGLDQLVLLGPKLAFDNYAMPSGHTSSAFMAMIFILFAHKLKGWKFLLLLIYAVLIATSRIAVGAHWPADICAGAAIGITLGLIFTELANREKCRLNHKAVRYITLLLYVPFIVMAISHVNLIDDVTSLINEGILVAAGIVALVFWIITAASLMNKKAPLVKH